MRFRSCLALLACSPSAASASTVVIWPIDPVIRTGEQATALWLENKGGEPVTLQVRSFAWSQADGEDRLEAQDAIVVSPPIATVAAGGRQLVRIIRRAPAPAPESAYRLLIDELPAPPAPGDGATPQARLSIQMRYSVPLFTYAGAIGAPRLSAEVAAGQNGRVLTIRNAGATHARLTNLRLQSGTREVVVKPGLAGYVLAGATLTVPLGNENGTVKVGVNGVDQVLGPLV